MVQCFVGVYYLLLVYDFVEVVWVYVFGQGFEVVGVVEQIVGWGQGGVCYWFMISDGGCWFVCNVVVLVYFMCCLFVGMMCVRLYFCFLGLCGVDVDDVWFDFVVDWIVEGYILYVG